MFEKLLSPLLLVDKVKCEANIKKMVSKIDHTKTIFKPHFKTHQSLAIGELFKKYGISKITVSSLEMAIFFADNGWDDITIAFPFNINWLDEIEKHLKKINLNVVIEDEFVLKEIIKKARQNIGIFIKIDTGSHRTGIEPDNLILLDKITRQISQNNFLAFKGFLAHAGHTYNCKDKIEVENIYYDSLAKLEKLKKHYIYDFKNIIISYGDTPSCSLIKGLNHFDEYRPGNFIFYDMMQYYLGSCAFEEIAVALACPVVAKHENRKEIIIHGGAIHLSKEFLEVDGIKTFGQMVFLKDGSWQKPDGIAYLKSLSQEHGVLKTDTCIFNQIAIGDTIGIIPVHSCLTAYQMRYNYTILNE